MKKIMMVGSVGCGKTTLCQRLNGLAREYKKTQALEVVNQTIDTPGEYLERRALITALLVTSAETDEVLLLQDATSQRYLYSPGGAGMFPVPTVGVVSKIDEATEQQRRDARELLELTGADPIFEVSAVTGAGMEALLAHLGQDTKTI